MIENYARTYSRIGIKANGGNTKDNKEHKPRTIVYDVLFIFFFEDTLQ